MGSKTKVHQLPYSQNQTSTYDFKSISDTAEGKDLAAWNPQIDPSIQARSDLAEQENANRWESDFTSGMPQHIKMRLQDSSARNIRSGANLERQQGEYLKNNLELQKKQALLPRLVQTSGTSNGFNSQITQTPSLWGSILGGAAQVGSAAIMASDERVKNIQGRSSVGLDEITQLEPTSYQYKPEAGLDDGKQHEGLVAQETEQVIPEAVGEDESGVKNINYEPIIAGLVNSVKQLTAKVDSMTGQPAAPLHRPMGGMR